MAIVAAAAPPAHGQTPAAGRFELGGGVVWLGGSTLGQRDATETTAAGSVSRLFSSSSREGGAPGLEAQVDIRVSRRFDAEAFASFAKPSLSVTVANDSEVAGSTTATETLKQYAVGGRVLWYVPSTGLQRTMPRARVFVSAGAAYLRQLHEGETLGVSGTLFDVGGGLKYMFRTRAGGHLKGTGLRGDFRVGAQRKGIAFDDSLRFAPSVGVSLFARF